MNFTEEYYPNLDELTPDVLAAARTQVVRLLQPSMPDVDFAPGTPTGDLVVSVLSAFFAATEEANNRLMSDLDLENVANGIIYSCNFVRAYLGNFAVYDVSNLRTSGLVRLTFKTPEARSLPKAVRFRFGSDTDYHLSLASPDSLGVSLLAAGTPHNGAADTYVLSQTSANAWSVDIPLEGNTTTAVAAGVTGTISQLPPDLIGIVSAIEFRPGLPPASLHELAQYARKVSHSLTASSRAGVTSMVARNWPETRMISPVLTGDAEMLRSPAGSAVVLQQPAMDVYLRSYYDMRRETQNIRLRYLTVDTTQGLQRVFRGGLGLLHRPSRIVSVEWSGTTTESLIGGYTVFAKSAKAELPNGAAFGSRYEELFIEVTPILADGTPLIPLSEDAPNGITEQYAVFTVTYEADPLLETMASTLEAPDNSPVGVSLLVKSGPLVVVDELAVNYTKRQGVRTLLTAAREKITSYMRSIGYPDGFRQTAIHDIMRAAGAERVLSITASGYTTPSVAGLLFTSAITDPAGAQITDDWLVNSYGVLNLPFATVSAIVPNQIVNTQNGPTAADLNLWAATARTVRYTVEPENITFVEI